MKRTLLLNHNYEALSFLTERRLMRFLLKDKVEIISYWDDKITWGSGSLDRPAIIKLKYYIKLNNFISNFSRKALIKRDNSTCQFCNKKLSPSQITIDHVIPKSQNGLTSFTNCVISCQVCNGRKANRTPEQANMILLRKPIHPKFNSILFMKNYQDIWYQDWDLFLN